VTEQAKGVTAAIADTPAKLAARCSAFFALNLHLPLSAASRAWNRRLRTWRGVENRHVQATRLPLIAWPAVVPRRRIRLAATSKRDGNVRLGELAILAQAAAATRPGDEIVEIGTFDGRTTLNLSLNAPHASAVFTLDLPPHQATRFELAAGERHFVDKPSPGERLRSCARRWRDDAARVVQLAGDSATFDWSAHLHKAGLVFVDGSHAYHYTRNDSETAFALVAEGGMVLWHDYGVWEGVTAALEELDAERKLGLRHIGGTSLVVWQCR
jgi:predicted O-methyltransferase YrrM